MKTKKILLLFQDISLSLLSSLLSILLVRWISHPTPEFSTTVCLWLCVSMAASISGIIFSGVCSVISCSVPQMCLMFLKVVVLKELVISAALVLGLVSFPEIAFSILAVLTDTVMSLFLLCFYGYMSRLLSMEEVERTRRIASRPNVLIAGVSEKAQALCREITSGDEYNVVGYITADKTVVGKVMNGVMVYHCSTFGDLHALECCLGGIDAIHFPDPLTPDGPFPEDVARNRTDDRLVVSDSMTAAGHFFKRVSDVMLSGILLLIFSPLFALCALAIKLEDGGPAIFRQERIGLGGRPFFILKFRSMSVDAEADGPRLWSGDGDPRLTRTGAFIRSHHLDELPQLWNVFRGDMSFIGYRPERQCFIDSILERNPRYIYLYQIRPGVTSYATLYNGYTDTMEKMLTRLDLDLYYLRNHSLAFDMRILGLTFLSIVFGKEF